MVTPTMATQVLQAGGRRVRWETHVRSVGRVGAEQVDGDGCEC